MKNYHLYLQLLGSSSAVLIFTWIKYSKYQVDCQIWQHPNNIEQIFQIAFKGGGKGGKLSPNGGSLEILIGGTFIWEGID